MRGGRGRCIDRGCDDGANRREGGGEGEQEGEKE